MARLRGLAVGILVGGLIIAFLVGASFKAEVTRVEGSLTTKSVSYVTSPQGPAESAFNYLFALLVAGPTVVAAATLYGAAEIASAVRRSGGRSRSGGLEVGDEV